MAQNPYQPPVAKVTPGQRFRPPLWLGALFGFVAVACVVVSIASFYASATINPGISDTFVSFNDGEFIELSTFLRNCSIGAAVAAGCCGIAALLSLIWNLNARDKRQA